MRVGPPLTAPVDTLALQNGGRGARPRRVAAFGAAAAPPGGADTTARGAFGGGGFGGGRGVFDPTFPTTPGRYVARLTVTPASGAPIVLEQPFALTKDPMVTLSDAELKQLYAYRLSVVKLQRGLRERQAQLDTAQRLYAAAKRAADSVGRQGDAGAQGADGRRGEGIG